MISPRRVALGALLLAASATYAGVLDSEQTSEPMVGMMVYDPPTWPVTPENGWNFTSEFAPKETLVYAPPQYDKKARPVTRHVGATMTTRFYGMGATFQAWTEPGSRVTASLDSDVTKSVETTGGRVDELVRLEHPNQENAWHTLKITLDAGAMQLYDVTFIHKLNVNYPSINEAPSINVQPLENKGISPFYNASAGGWKPEQLFDPDSEHCANRATAPSQALDTDARSV